MGGVDLRWLALATLVAAGCGDDDAAPPLDSGSSNVDAGSDAGPGFVEAMPEAPMPPAPVQWDCPEGWTEVQAGEVTACEPWPASFAGCADDQERFVGDEECAPWGDDCAAGWPQGLPAQGVYFVSADAAVDGDGSRDAPFTALGQALQQDDVSVVAIAPGVYAERLVLDRDVELRGTCARETLLSPIRQPEDAELAAAIRLEAGRVTIRDLGVRGSLAGIRLVGGELELERVELRDLESFGIVGDADTVLAGSEVIIRGVRGRLVAISMLGRAAFERLIVEDCETLGARVSEDGGELELVDTVVRDIVVSSEDGENGIGVYSSTGGQLTLRRVVLERNRSLGGLVENGGMAHAEDLVIRDVGPDEHGLQGGGLLLRSDSVAVVERAFVTDVPLAGITSFRDGSMLTLRDAVLFNNPEGGGLDPEGSVANDGAALAVIFGASALIERVHIEQQAVVGLTADNGTEVTLRDVTIVNVLPRSDSQVGRAISLNRRSVVQLERVEIRDVVESALFAGGAGCEILGSDVHIEDVKSLPESGLLGRGLTAQLGARMELNRVHIERAREAAIFCGGQRAHMNLRNLRVVDTLQRECAETACVGAGGGTGVAVIDEASIELETFVVEQSHLAGLQFARGASGLARDGVVSGNAVGVNLQGVDFPLDDISDNVIFRDNGTNLDSSSLPVPDPIQ